MAATESEVLCEIEVLQSIYLDDLRVTRTHDRRWEVSLVLYPSTAEDCGSQFVRLGLTLTLDDQYPCSSPVISIHNPRGLSDDKLSSLQRSLELEAESCVGSPILYQLIEVTAVTLYLKHDVQPFQPFFFNFVIQKAKEILTESNIPHGNCVICLYGFKEGESFSKTRCYHYFHSHCLGRYARHSEEEIRLRQQEMADDKTDTQHQELTVVCPVCREPLTYDLGQLMASAAPQLPELDGAAIRSKFRQKWQELEKVLDRQRSRGGVIDPEEESNRFLIHINEVMCRICRNPVEAKNLLLLHFLLMATELWTLLNLLPVSFLPQHSTFLCCQHIAQALTGSLRPRSATAMAGVPGEEAGPECITSKEVPPSLNTWTRSVYHRALPRERPAPHVTACMQT
ncbi:E3 ubiquitin-protein ligase RNF25 isoform X3 [Hippocampus zosterae]|uniref:E3 ubiquitin-protein ligase RNF25 isoform X3 n=1 Tax=Hippocampus zosterae TaxID=109293 RepID=UPI00223E5B6C|nr:E3 ubiquitin-protein ligase RNF25 isoform X3 [Hippocampus zosterae]